MGWRMIHENPSPLNPRAASLSYPHDGQAPMKKIFAPEAMLPDGWIRDVVVEIDDEGNIAAARGRQNAAGAESAGGAVIPGMANVHSHAFQRAMAGLAERMGSPEDSFWTWREVMYSFLKQLGPDHVSAIASQLYCEMLKNGYTAVAEFHYLHNAPDGKPYANRVEMAQQHLLAAQVKEVNDCLTWSGQRPVEWLLSNMPVDSRWCLAHCTHISQSEAEKLSASGAVVGLCPTTEGNLGDGIFPFSRFREKRGRWGIGGGWPLSQAPVQELSWLEYVQRLAARRRNIAASPSQPSVGATLWREAAAGGAQALARPMGAIAPGVRADLVVLNADHINLVGRNGDGLLDALLFAGDGQMVKHVMVGGKWIVRDGRHPDEAVIAARYRQVKKQLYSAL